jgi:hypothetical protein
MQCFERAAARDAIVVVARAAVTAWLRLAAAASGLRRSLRLRAAQPAPGPADPVAEAVRKLEGMVERTVWRGETLAALHTDALSLIARAEADYANALAQLQRLRAVQQVPLEAAPQPASDAPLAA